MKLTITPINNNVVNIKTFSFNNETNFKFNTSTYYSGDYKLITKEENHYLSIIHDRTNTKNALQIDLIIGDTTHTYNGMIAPINNEFYFLIFTTGVEVNWHSINAYMVSPLAFFGTIQDLVYDYENTNQLILTQFKNFNKPSITQESPPGEYYWINNPTTITTKTNKKDEVNGNIYSIPITNIHPFTQEGKISDYLENLNINYSGQGLHNARNFLETKVNNVYLKDKLSPVLVNELTTYTTYKVNYDIFEQESLISYDFNYWTPSEIYERDIKVIPQIKETIFKPLEKEYYYNPNLGFFTIQEKPYFFSADGAFYIIQGQGSEEHGWSIYTDWGNYGEPMWLKNNNNQETIYNENNKNDLNQMKINLDKLQYYNQDINSNDTKENISKPQEAQVSFSCENLDSITIPTIKLNDIKEYLTDEIKTNMVIDQGEFVNYILNWEYAGVGLGGLMAIISSSALLIFWLKRLR